MEAERIVLVVCYADDTDNPKGIMTPLQYERLTNPHWIRRTELIEVNRESWDNGYINITMAKELVHSAKVNSLRESMPWMGDGIASLFGIH